MPLKKYCILESYKHRLSAKDSCLKTRGVSTHYKALENRGVNTPKTSSYLLSIPQLNHGHVQFDNHKKSRKCFGHLCLWFWQVLGEH